MLSRLLCLCFFWIAQNTVFAALVNVTVDDTSSLLVYAPTPGIWSQGNQCSGCSTKPNPQMMLDGTWHDGQYVPKGTSSGATGPLTITFTFTGTAIYAYGAVHSFMDMTFLIDGQSVGQFTADPTDYLYNVTLFAHTGLSSGQHTFVLMAGSSDGSGQISLVLFDYLVYTHDDGQSPAVVQVQSQSPSVNAPTPSSTPQITTTPGQPSTFPNQNAASTAFVSTSQVISASGTSSGTLSGTLSGSGTHSETLPVSGSSSGMIAKESSVTLRTTLETSGSVTVALVQTLSNNAPVGAVSQTSSVSPISDTGKAHKSMGIAAIAGIAVGGALLVILFVVGMFVWQRRKASKSRANSLDVQHFGPSTDRLPFFPSAQGATNESQEKGHLRRYTTAMTATNHTVEAVNSSTIIASSTSGDSDSIGRSSFSTQLPRRYREFDAGPLPFPGHSSADYSDSGSALPPDYHQVFSPASPRR
ncbi:hypothetical protein M422DRAFT_243315 [Sphaerobolus stellatus SS14]|nr:hypothetical protein M422DRAFT_243315 [Sphaerobolus stellatus SS14]